MATVVLVRHGRSTANTAGVLAGRLPGVRLDERGEEQVAHLAERLEGVRLATVLTSPLERCRATAEAAISKVVPAPTPVEEPALLECHYGAWQGRSIEELAKEELWRTVQAHPSAARFPDGESLVEMSSRVVRAVREHDARVEAEHGPGAVWLLVSHGDPLKAVLADALGMHLDLFQRLVVDPASASVVRYTTSRPYVLATNTTRGNLGWLTPPQPAAPAHGATTASGDAVVGGGTGVAETPGTTEAEGAEEDRSEPTGRSAS